MIRVLLIATVAVGCAPPPNYTGRFVPVLSVACGVAEATTSTPGPDPAPTPSGVPRPADCPDLCDNGVIGDGRIVLDCPTCDQDGDGSADDPVIRDSAVTLRNPEPEPEPVEEPPLTWHGTPEAAAAEATRRGVSVLVFLTDKDGCPACTTLRNTIDHSPLLRARLRRYALLACDYRPWIKGDAVLPTVLLWRPGDQDELPLLSADGFQDLTDAESVAVELQEWIDETQ